MTRGADRLLAVLLTALAAACLVHLYLLPGGKDLTAMHGAWGTRMAAFSLLAFACLVGAVAFWAGLVRGQPAHPAGAPLFGRAAEPQETGRPGLRKVFLALPLIVLAALAIDRFGPWHDGGELAAQPSQPKAASPN
ncbi:WD40 repeat domain-containing protein, partial [Mesorhizobium intechi]